MNNTYNYTQFVNELYKACDGCARFLDIHFKISQIAAKFDEYFIFTDH